MGKRTAGATTVASGPVDPLTVPVGERVATAASSADARRGKARTCRMFDTPIIERLSRIHPVTVFAFWLPIVVAVSVWNLAEGMNLFAFGGLLSTGWLGWTLTEYGLHRFVFHFRGAKPWQRRLHFIVHGVHHDYPSDAGRLVMPLPVTIPIGLVFYFLSSALVGSFHGVPLFVGFGIGYLAYDGVHYATHHVTLRRWPGKWLKRYHLVHHFAGFEAKWGVSMPLWDYVFGTVEDTRDRSTLDG